MSDHEVGVEPRMCDPESQVKKVLPGEGNNLSNTK